MAEAVAQLQKGLELLASLPKKSARQQQELDLQVALGPALMVTKGWAAPDVGETYARASALAERWIGADYLVPLLYGQWAYHLVRSGHELALPPVQKLRQTGAALNNIGALLLGRECHGCIYFFMRRVCCGPPPARSVSWLKRSVHREGDAGGNRTEINMPRFSRIWP